MTESLYLCWPDGLRPPDVDVPAGYALRTSRLAGRDLAAVEGLLDGERAAARRDRVLPNGSFVAVERATNAVVGTCSATHEPNADDHYFPFGGRVAALVVDSTHRREGLGRALAAAATRRLLDAGYDSVRAEAAADQLPALALHLNAGFAPAFLGDGDVGQWRDVFDRLGLPFDPERCVRP